jgi:hypothetical protein
LQNISGNHAATWQQKLAADFPHFLVRIKHKKVFIIFALGEKYKLTCKHLMTIGRFYIDLESFS